MKYVLDSKYMDCVSVMYVYDPVSDTYLPGVVRGLGKQWR